MNKIDEQFIKEKVNPVVGFIYHTARQLGEDHAPNSMDMQYLKQGTEKVCELLREASPTAPPAESVEDAKAFDAKGDAWDAFLMRKNPVEYADSYAGFQFGWNAAIQWMKERRHD